MITLKYKVGDKVKYIGNKELNRKMFGNDDDNGHPSIYNKEVIISSLRRPRDTIYDLFYEVTLINSDISYSVYEWELESLVKPRNHLPWFMQDNTRS